MRWSRVAAACGALFPLGILIGDDMINGAGEAPSPVDREDDSIAEVRNYLTNAADAASNGSYWIGRGIGVIALIALLVFALDVSRRIRQREGEDRMLSGLAVGAGVLAVSLGLLSAVAQFAVVARADDGIDLQVARTLLDLSSIAFILMWLPLAVFLAVTAAAGSRTPLLPRWLVISAALLAGGLVLGLAAMPASNAGFFSIVLSFLWFVAASVALMRRADA
jgi:hypothetical protein